MIEIIDRGWCFFLDSRILRSRFKFGRSGRIEFRFFCKSGLIVLETELSFRPKSIVLAFPDRKASRTVACGRACQAIYSSLLEALSQKKPVFKKRETDLSLDIKDLSDLAQIWPEFFFFRDDSEFTTFSLRGLFKVSERARVSLVKRY